MIELLSNKAPRVLVIDDDATLRLLICEKLKKNGFDAVGQNCGEEGIEYLRHKPVDLVLLDVIMPGINGFETCQQIRANESIKNIPVVIMTASENDDDAVGQAYHSGATDFTTKPLNFALLSHRIRYILRSSQTAETLRHQQEKLKTAQSIAKVGDWQVNTATDELTLSDAAKEILAFPSQQHSYSLFDLTKRVEPALRLRAEEQYFSAKNSNTSVIFEHALELPNNQVKLVKQTARIEIDSSNGESYLIGMVQDITEERCAQEKMYQLAYIDKLTELPNRSLLDDYLNSTLSNADQQGKQVALLSIELGKMRRITDSLGHTFGDELIKSVAMRIKNTLQQCQHPFSDWRLGDDNHRSAATLARFSGAQFVIVLPGINSGRDIAETLHLLMQALNKPHVVQNNEIFMAAHIGLSIYPQQADSAETLLKHADLAMNVARQSSGVSYEIYTDSLSDAANEQLSIENSLHKALDNNEFHLAYQPKVDPKTLKVVGAEALIRWQHPEKGNISPASFIPIAEKNGLISPIGEWIIRTACQQSAQWQQDGHTHLHIAINLSARQLANKSLFSTIASIIEETGANPHSIEFELTESVLMEAEGVVKKLIKNLRNMGIKIALDDFGTGYSSFGYLKELPIDIIKLDKSFIDDLLSNNNALAIISCIISLAKDLGLEVVAEGVENKDQLQMLSQLGCNVIQGYYYSKPLTANEFEYWLSTHNNQQNLGDSGDLQTA